MVAKFFVKESAIYVTLNGLNIYTVLPCDNGKTIKLKANAQKGNNKLSFCTAGCKRESRHQVAISNIIIYQKQCVPSWGKDLIVNGGF